MRSSLATGATMGMTAIPEMKKYQYDNRLSTGCVAAGGTLGILIPPSIGFIIYGILTEVSIGKLFMAGFIPGILLALLFIATIFILCTINPKMGPRGQNTSFGNEDEIPFRNMGDAAAFHYCYGRHIYGCFYT
jgi:TRAP-type C4-dicarboxylate transport system permease large subunit